MLTIAALVIAALLCAVAVFGPSLVSHGGGKLLGFAALFLIPILVTGMVGHEHLERSKSTDFCLSCHVMKDYGQSLRIDDIGHLPAAHFQNGRVPRDSACYSCHTTYTVYGDLTSKMRGLKHVWAQYFAGAPKKVKLYTPYNNRECLHCHERTRGFEETSAHREDATTMARIRTNTTSCLSAGCHPVTHEVDKLPKLKMWNGPQGRLEASR